jgi:hypothetical protein
MDSQFVEISWFQQSQKPNYSLRPPAYLTVLSLSCGTMRSVLTEQAAKLPEEFPAKRDRIASHGSRTPYPEFNPAF